MLENTERRVGVAVHRTVKRTYFVPRRGWGSTAPTDQRLKANTLPVYLLVFLLEDNIVYIYMYFGFVGNGVNGCATR